jgi:hypothetical protein
VTAPRAPAEESQQIEASPHTPASSLLEEETRKVR